MSETNHDKIEFGNLQKFLAEIGFERSMRMNGTIAFHHSESGTIVTLSIPENGRDVRPADLLSIIVRLENAGLVGESELQEFRSGKLPLAS